ncbi:MAG: hypothetical protein M0Z56_06945, partial [Desulfobacteraceae bacterium]|nr:hypothetical protein [Desulfobacteraceae bacterium]
MNTSGPSNLQPDLSSKTAFVQDSGFLKPQAQTSLILWKKRLRAAGKSLQKGANVGVGILNGVVGDYLHHHDNPLAVRMGFYFKGKPLPLTPDALRSVYPHMTSKICVI